MALTPLRCCPYCFRFITGEEIQESGHDYSSFPRDISDRTDIIECRRSTIKLRMKILGDKFGCPLCKRGFYGTTEI